MVINFETKQTMFYLKQLFAHKLLGKHLLFKPTVADVVLIFYVNAAEIYILLSSVYWDDQ